MSLKEEECLPLTLSSFRVLIQQYEEEAAAARAAVANSRTSAIRSQNPKSKANLASSSGDNHSSVSELSVVAQYVEDLSSDARRLYMKLQKEGPLPQWSSQDVRTLRLLGFDIGGVPFGDVNGGAHNVAHATKETAPSTSTCSDEPIERNGKSLDTLLLVEKRVQSLKQRVGELSAENAALRDALRQARGPKDTETAPKPFSEASATLAALAEELRAWRTTLLRQSKSEVHTEQSPDVAKEVRERFALALGEAKKEGNRLRAANAALDIPYSSVEDALLTLHQLDAAERVRYALGPSCTDAGPVDAAVLRLLHDLDFGVPIHMRRLGPDGDYFIDRRVRIKLTSGQLLVRPVIEAIPDEEPPGYELLAKYLVDLYSPLMDLDRAVGGSPHVEEEVEAASSDRVDQLRRQQRDLKRSLHAHQAQLQRHHQRLVEEMSSSPITTPQSGAEANIASSILMGNRNGDTVTQLARLMETNGTLPDLSSLSEMELHRLRRLAAQRQLRSANVLSGLLSPRAHSESH